MDKRIQYDGFAEKFSNSQKLKNQASKEAIHSMIGKNLAGQKILDLGSGDGIDANYFHAFGPEMFGVDASEELVALAKKEYPGIQFSAGLAEDTPFAGEMFDIVYSKYVIMTSEVIAPIYNEVHRVLKTGGTFIFLVVHPLRQFIERKKGDANYFEQEYVDSILFDGEVIAQEPTHTMGEYLSDDFLTKFDVVRFEEKFDPDAEKINDATYPGFFVIKAIKR